MPTFPRTRLSGATSPLVSHDARSIALALGIGQYNATMVIPTMFMIPRTTDPDAQATILLVEAVQRGLQHMGAPIQVTSILDKDTVQHLLRVSGPNWHQRTWMQIMGDITDAISVGRKFEPMRSDAVGYFDLPGEPVIWAVGALAAGGFLLYRAMKG